MAYLMLITGFLAWRYSLHLGNKGRSDPRSDGELGEAVVAFVGAILFTAGAAWNGWID